MCIWCKLNSWTHSGVFFVLFSSFVLCFWFFFVWPSFYENLSPLRSYRGTMKHHTWYNCIWYDKKFYTTKVFSAKTYDDCGVFYVNSHRKRRNFVHCAQTATKKKIDQKHNKIVVKIRRTVYTRPREKQTITMAEGRKLLNLPLQTMIKTKMHRKLRCCRF